MRSLLIVVAFKEEFKAVKKLLKNKAEIEDKHYRRARGEIEGYPVEVLMTSMGMKAARKASVAVMSQELHGGVLVLGYCGGLAPTIKVGDTIVPTQLMNFETNEKISIDLALCERVGKAHLCEGLTYRSVPMITKDRVVETPAEKSTIYESSHAEAVDMECFEVAQAAVKKDLKTLVAKIIVDDSEMELPHFNDYFDKKGKMDHLNMTQVLVSQPALSLSLSKNMKQANQIFQTSIPSIVTVVCEQWQIQKL